MKVVEENGVFLIPMIRLVIILLEVLKEVIEFFLI